MLCGLGKTIARATVKQHLEELIKMTRADFNAVVAGKLDMKAKDAAKVIDAVLESIQESVVKGEKVTFSGFGTFEVRERAAREGRNPATGESMHIDATKVPAFKFSKTFKDAVK